VPGIKKTLVVAKYKEDTNWTKDVASDWRVLIITKDVDIPNAGREAASYFYAIIKHYNQIKPQDIWAFSQGNPFDHAPDIVTQLNQPIEGYTALGGHVTKTTDGNGGDDHPNLPVKEKYELWLKKDFPGHIEFKPGAQFMINGQAILKHPKDWYIQMMDNSTEAYNPYVLERLWPEIFA
jgi:hypothetical protein